MSTGLTWERTCRGVMEAGPESMTNTSTSGQLHGKTVLVTGASRGIGRAIAKRLAAEGARVGVHYARNGEAAEMLAQSLPGSGHVCLEADLGETEQAATLATAASNALGGLDILVNNAGIFETQPVDGSAESWRKNWERTLAVNLNAPALLCHAAAQLMASRGSGRIINITSRRTTFMSLRLRPGLSQRIWQRNYSRARKAIRSGRRVRSVVWRSRKKSHIRSLFLHARAASI